MNRTLGIDLGTNSIGWAIIENNQVTEMGTRIFPSAKHKPVANQIKITTFDKFKKVSLNKKIAITLIVIMSMLALMNLENWQFWFSLSIASVLTLLTINK